MVDFGIVMEAAEEIYWFRGS